MGEDDLYEMENALSLVLRGGVLLSATLIVVGLVLMSVTGDTTNPFGVMNLDWIIGGNPFLQPSHILFLGFAVLIITPMMRVAASIFIYIKEHDLPFTAITIIVLLILIIGMIFGIG